MRHILLLLLVLLTASCASVSNLGMTPSVSRTVVVQRQLWDCVIAALAMTLDKTYDEVEAARVETGITFVSGGLNRVDAIKIAKHLGFNLRYKEAKDVNLLKDRGMLVTGRADGLPYHAVYLEQGFIYDPQGTMIEPWMIWFQPRTETFVAYLLERR